MVLRDYNQIKDNLEDKNDEIKGLKADLEKANELLGRQQNRLVLYSTPISQKLPKLMRMEVMLMGMMEMKMLVIMLHNKKISQKHR